MKNLPEIAGAGEPSRGPVAAKVAVSGEEGLARRQVVLGSLFAGLSAASMALLPRGATAPLPRGELETWMPAAVGPYSVYNSADVVLPPADQLADRNYDNVVTRIYTAPSRPTVMLLLAYSSTQDGTLQVHRPEFCYQANGF